MSFLSTVTISALSGAAAAGSVLAAASFVSLQPTTPGTTEAGHTHISGYSLADRFGANCSPTLGRVQIQEDGALQALRAISGTGVAVYGQSNATTGLGAGGYFTSKSAGGRALVADQLSPTGNTVGGLFYTHTPTSVSLWGTARGSSGTATGVRGDSASPTGIGVYGTGTGIGGKFESTGSGIAIVAGKDDTQAAAISARASNQDAYRGGTIYAANSSVNLFTGGMMVKDLNGGSGCGINVQHKQGENTSTTAINAAAGFFNLDASGGFGLFASTYAASGYGVYAQGSGSGGNVGLHVAGNSEVTGTKSFIIDHPLDPANKTLKHFCAEGPEPTNVYSGTAVIGSDGAAWVALPSYFEAINKDVRYQLTCVGGYSPVYIATEVSGNKFKIAGGRSGLKVSWQVTGTRNDAYVRAHGFQAESYKSLDERGSCLSPEAYGLPQERSQAMVHTAIKYPDGSMLVAGKLVPANTRP